MGWCLMGLYTLLWLGWIAAFLLGWLSGHLLMGWWSL